MRTRAIPKSPCIPFEWDLYEKRRMLELVNWRASWEYVSYRNVTVREILYENKEYIVLEENVSGTYALSKASSVINLAPVPHYHLSMYKSPYTRAILIGGRKQAMSMTWVYRKTVIPWLSSFGWVELSSALLWWNSISFRIYNFLEIDDFEVILAVSYSLALLSTTKKK